MPVRTKLLGGGDLFPPTLPQTWENAGHPLADEPDERVSFPTTGKFVPMTRTKRHCPAPTVIPVFVPSTAEGHIGISGDVDGRGSD